MFLGFSILLSISLNGQALRENAISIEGNAGYEQQKINIGYSYNAGRFESSENKNQSNQFILGFEAGLVQYRYKYPGEITPWPYRWSQGVHVIFL